MFSTEITLGFLWINFFFISVLQLISPMRFFFFSEKSCYSYTWDAPVCICFMTFCNIFLVTCDLWSVICDLWSVKKTCRVFWSLHILGERRKFCLLIPTFDRSSWFSSRRQNSVLRAKTYLQRDLDVKKKASSRLDWWLRDFFLIFFFLTLHL